MIGVDEVGRGCWAGPLLVVAARQTSNLPKGLADSKKLTKKRREQLFNAIRTSCQLGEGWVSVHEIDKFGLTAATKLGVARALSALKASSQEEIIMDGIINYCDVSFVNVVCEARADDVYPVVSAASIYAKVTRDSFMVLQSEEFPEYGFNRHVGYGTREHLQALKVHGISVLHRQSFKPVRGFASS